MASDPSPTAHGKKGLAPIGGRGIPGDLKLTEGAMLPEGTELFIDFEGWARSVFHGVPYEEPDKEYLSRMLAFKAITAKTVEEAFGSMGISRLQETLPDTPGASTGPLELTELYVASSDFETGNPCYVIVTATRLDTGKEKKFSTGATNVQATLIGLLKLGYNPIRFQVKRGDSKDKGGRYLLHLLPPD